MKIDRIIYVAILFVYSCSEGPTTDETLKPHEHHAPSLSRAQGEALGVRTATPTYHHTGDTLLMRGVVDAPPQSLVDVALPYGGVIKRLNFYPGSHVKKGDLLAEVNHQDYIDLQEGYLGAVAAMEETDAAWKRQEQLMSRSSTSEKNYQEVRAAYQAAKSRLEGFEARLKLAGLSAERIRESGIQDAIYVYAPVSGYITDILANIGKYVPDDATIYRIVDTDHLHIELNAYPEDVNRLHAGQKVHFKLKQTGTVHSGEVYLISQIVEEDRTVRVHVHPDASITGMLPGMYVQGRIAMDGDSIWGLPASAGIMADGALKGLAANGAAYDLVTFGEGIPGRVIALDESETRPFVIERLERAMAAFTGEADAEAGHSH